ncbi:MAG: hypothetical protein JSS77_13395 [Acidobacteria bacterium]|nr:hypothetical protein [Acidobacteriota bacterium]
MNPVSKYQKPGLSSRIKGTLTPGVASSALINVGASLIGFSEFSPTFDALLHGNAVSFVLTGSNKF